METTNVTQVSAPVIAIDSARIDRALMAATLEHQADQIKRATWQLRKGLRLQDVAMRDMHFREALRILRGLGEG